MSARPRTRREDRPDMILDAGEAVLRRSGARGLTIDAVAAEAKLSKGGVLHHFASKDALIRALVDRKFGRLRDSSSEHEARLAPDPMAPGLAMVANMRQTYGEEDGFPRALLLASVEIPDALTEFRAFLSERMAMAHATETRPGTGSVLVFAMLGLMIGRTLGLHDLSGAEADRVFDAFKDIARKLGTP